MGTFLGVLGLVALAALLLLGLWLWLDARRTVRRLDRMLSTAIDGGGALSLSPSTSDPCALPQVCPVPSARPRVRREYSPTL